MLYGCVGELGGGLWNRFWGCGDMVVGEEETKGGGGKRLAFLE